MIVMLVIYQIPWVQIRFVGSMEPMEPLFQFAGAKGAPSLFTKGCAVPVLRTKLYEIIGVQWVLLHLSIFHISTRQFFVIL